MINFKKIHIVYFIFFLVLSACKTMDTKKKNIIINELLILCDYKDDACSGVSFSYFKDRHNIIKNRQIVEKVFEFDTITEALIFNGNYKPISLMTLVNRYDVYSFDYEDVVIENGYITEYQNGIYNYNDTIMERENLKTIEFKKGFISGEYKIINTEGNLLYKTTFKKGNGYWKEYYYKTSKLKEEGRVENNYKVGLWKYYNLLGTLDSTKTYTVKDAVDVRFPFNLFNKMEPLSALE